MQTYLIITTLIWGLACPCFAKKQGAAKGQAATHTNVSYGKYERNELDFWQAKGEGPRPLLIYIHGGGWIKGDKKAMQNPQAYLAHGISVASVNYRLLGEGVTLPTPVHDAARAVQFLRSKAREWNIDKNKIVLSGQSAGACSSLWIACHDDLAKPQASDPVERESTRVLGAGVRIGQTSIDPVIIEPWIGPNVYHPMIYKAVGEESAEAMQRNYAKHKELYQEFSAINHLSKDDPPLFLEYYSRFDMSVPAKSINHGIHHPVFGAKFKEQSSKVGHNKAELMIKNHDESKQFSNVDDFVIKTLTGGGGVSVAGDTAASGDKLETIIPKPSTIISVPSKLKKFMPKRHNAKLTEAKAGSFDLVMIGDSITHNWEGQKNYKSSFAGVRMLNLGFAGDRTQNVLWRIEHGALDGISPKLVTLMIGTNHAHDPRKGFTPDQPEDVFTGIKAIVAQVRTRLPNAKLIVFSVFPRGPKTTQARVSALNTMLPKLADGKQVLHMDINETFLGKNGTYNPALYKRDQLHLDAKGYDAWAKALLPILKQYEIVK
ncbi:MAG: GDSL-type esterase/lipase family protein [Akkermansiaceae bacterium]|nr:GDSL-type esterase/lipase family protein [Akkermansiaceae bacterium]